MSYRLLKSSDAPPVAADPTHPLAVRRVSKTFTPGIHPPWRTGPRRRVRAVQDVSFDVAPRSIFGLIGANGSGKSTLIRILSSLVLADEGDVSVFGFDVERDAMQARQL